MPRSAFRPFPSNSRMPTVCVNPSSSEPNESQCQPSAPVLQHPNYVQPIIQPVFRPITHQGASLSQSSQPVPPEKIYCQPITLQSESSEDEVDEHESKLLTEVEIIGNSLIRLTLLT